MTKTPKVVAIFTAGGLASALITQLLSYLPTELAVAAVGPVFAALLGLSIVISYRLGWLRSRVSFARSLASALSVSVAFPLAIAGLVAGLIAIDALFPRL